MGRGRAILCGEACGHESHSVWNSLQHSIIYSSTKAKSQQPRCYLSGEEPKSWVMAYLFEFRSILETSSMTLVTTHNAALSCTGWRLPKTVAVSTAPLVASGPSDWPDARHTMRWRR